MTMEMSRSIAHPVSYNGSFSSSSNNDQLHAGANGEKKKDADVHSHIIELSKIVDGEMRSNTWASRSSQAKTIFRVPKEKLQAAADRFTYQPTFLSIGPYHCAMDDDATDEMRRNEQGKLFCLNWYISHDAAGRSVLEYLEAVESMEAAARSCYEGDVEMDRYAFCRMLLLDAFQLILLLERFGSVAEETTGAAGGGGGGAAAATAAAAAACQGTGCRIRPRNMSMTVHDLMMLENQIPFFVVDKIYELRYGNSGNVAAAAATTTTTPRRPVRQLAWETIKGIVRGVPSAPNVPDDMEFQHLVHVCHVYLKPTCLNQNDVSVSRLTTPGKYGRFRRATEYYEAGVKFRQWCAAAGRRPMLDVAFTTTDGVLSVALQDIDEKTGYILRNVLAYEQTKDYRTATSGAGSYVTAYVVFMSQLLGSAEDVALLSRRGVLEHLLGDDAEVCALFRGLAAGLAFDPGSDHYLNPVGVALQAHCRCRRYRWRAWIVRHRFGNPWLVAAWLFGASAVLCTIVQTVFAVLAYVKQNKHAS